MTHVPTRLNRSIRPSWPARTLAPLLLVSVFMASVPAVALAAPPTGQYASQPDCLGERQPLTVAAQMPYALVSVGGHEGYMVLDFGASVSSITPANFQGGAPQPTIDAASSTCNVNSRFGDFVFFGSWGSVQLPVQAQPAVQQLRTADGQATIRQAGVLGTDFLAQHVYTLDYRAGHLWRAASGSFCNDATLQGAGYRPVSTWNYYGNQPGNLSCPMAGAAPGGCVNIPTIPISIGGVQAVAQLDTGYDDSRQPYSVNINAALFDALQAAAKVQLTPRPDITGRLSTCVAGVSEALEAYSLDGNWFGIVDTGGWLVPHHAASVTLFVKRTPDAAAVCGGIGTWKQPAAQLGASFVAGGSLVVDPFSARVWLR